MSHNTPPKLHEPLARRVTISHIAKEAGVSKTAVSFAFNDPSQLASSTVEHIREVADRLGYTPDPIARSMTTRRTNALGLLLPQAIGTAMANPYYAPFLAGVGQVCGITGHTLMLVPPLWGSVLKAIPAASVDGFIVVGLEIDRGEVLQLRRRRVPFVMVDSDAPDDVLAVNVDDRGGARAIMERVLAHGHRRIAILCFESWHIRADAFTGTLAARLAGYGDALAAAGMALDSPMVATLGVQVSRDGGRDGYAQLREQGFAPSAIVAMSDVIAFGAIEAALDDGRAVPGDISVVGFDDLPEARYVLPGLTTVAQAVEAKGRLAAELLTAALAGPLPPEHRLLPTTVVMRGSLGVAGSS